MKADRKKSILNIRRVWLEKNLKWSNARKSAFESELKRIARFSDLNEYIIAADALENG